MLFRLCERRRSAGSWTAGAEARLSPTTTAATHAGRLTSHDNQPVRPRRTLHLHTASVRRSQAGARFAGKLANMAPRAAALLLVLAFAAPAAAQRLPTTVVPEHYDLTFSVDLARARFDGT